MVKIKQLEFKKMHFSRNSVVFLKQDAKYSVATYNKLVERCMVWGGVLQCDGATQECVMLC